MRPELELILDEARGAWRFRYIALAVAFAVAFLGWAVVFALPDRYQADARVFVDTRTALKPALQGLTTDQNVEAQINYVRQSLLEGPQLEEIAEETGVLPKSLTDERARSRILDDFGNRITLTVSSAGSQGDERSAAGTVYGFHYLDLTRARSLLVVDKLLNTFVEKTLGGKREGSENVLALVAVKGPATAIHLAATYLTHHQCRDGGWQYSLITPCARPNPKTYSGPDTNSSALAVMAVVAAGGRFPHDPLAFFRASQETDGSFGYYGLPGDGQRGDPDSTAEVVQALIALGATNDKQFVRHAITPRRARELPVPLRRAGEGAGRVLLLRRPQPVRDVAGGTGPRGCDPARQCSQAICSCIPAHLQRGLILRTMRPCSVAPCMNSGCPRPRCNA